MKTSESRKPEKVWCRPEKNFPRPSHLRGRAVPIREEPMTQSICGYFGSRKEPEQ